MLGLKFRGLEISWKFTWLGSDPLLAAQLGVKALILSPAAWSDLCLKQRLGFIQGSGAGPTHAIN